MSKHLPGANPGPGVDRMDLDALPPEPSEDASIGGTAADDLCEHGGHGRHRQVAGSHPHHQRPDPIAPVWRPMGDARDRSAVQEEHSARLLGAVAR